MNNYDEELKKRYIYDIVRRLPKVQRDEVSMELEELIDDMYESKKGTVEEILIQLGNPKEFAKKYYNHEYLIGPEYFNTYSWVLKITLLCVGLTNMLSELYECLLSSKGLVSVITHVITEVSITLLCTFGVITIIFYIVEHAQEQDGIGNKEESDHNSTQAKGNVYSTGKKIWVPKDLKPVPKKKATISKGDNIVGFAITLFFGILFIVKPSMFSVFFFVDHKLVDSIPVLNINHWDSIVPFLVVILVLIVADQLIKIIKGCYCKLVLISNVIINIIQLVLLTILFKSFTILNPSFAEELAYKKNIKQYSKGDILYYWGTNIHTNIILLVIYIIIFCEIGYTIYMTVKYGSLGKKANQNISTIN